MQVANIDMTDSSHTCPQGLRILNTPLRMCGRNTTSAGCSSATFDSHGIPYTRVCGKITGYQNGSTDAFNNNRALTIDDTYIDGVSLSHGSNLANIYGVSQQLLMNNLVLTPSVHALLDHKQSFLHGLGITIL